MYFRVLDHGVRPATDARGRAYLLTDNWADWFNAFHYILNNAAFPKPLITMSIADGLSVLDGNHRIGAFCGLQKMPTEDFAKRGLKKPAQEQVVWVGTHSHGEVPLD